MPAGGTAGKEHDTARRAAGAKQQTHFAGGCHSPIRTARRHDHLLPPPLSRRRQGGEPRGGQAGRDGFQEPSLSGFEPERRTRTAHRTYPPRGHQPHLHLGPARRTGPRHFHGAHGGAGRVPQPRSAGRCHRTGRTAHRCGVSRRFLRRPSGQRLRLLALAQRQEYLRLAGLRPARRAVCRQGGHPHRRPRALPQHAQRHFGTRRGLRCGGGLRGRLVENFLRCHPRHEEPARHPAGQAGG